MVDLNIDWLLMVAAVEMWGILMKSYHLIMTEKDEGKGLEIGIRVSVGDV